MYPVLTQPVSTLPRKYLGDASPFSSFLGLGGREGWLFLSPPTPPWLCFGVVKAEVQKDLSPDRWSLAWRN